MEDVKIFIYNKFQEIKVIECLNVYATLKRWRADAAL